MPNQKWDDATVASVLVRLVRFMGMPSIPWEDFGDQVDIPGYKLKVFIHTVIIGAYQRETRYQDKFAKFRRALLAFDLENDSTSDVSGDDDKRQEWIPYRRRSSTATSSYHETPSSRKRKRRRTGTNKNASYHSRNSTHDHTSATSTIPASERHRSNGAQHANGMAQEQISKCHTRSTHKNNNNSQEGPKAINAAPNVQGHQRRYRTTSTISTHTIGQPTHLSDSNSTPISPRRNFGQAGNHADPLKLRRPTQPLSTMRRRRSQNQARRTNLSGSSSATSSSLSNPIEVSSDEGDESDGVCIDFITEDVMHIPMNRFTTMAEQRLEIMSTSATTIILDDEPTGDGPQATYLCRIIGDPNGRKIARDEIARKFQKVYPKDRKGKGRALS